VISKAILRYIRMSPRKPRLVADMVRGKPINEALAILSNVHKKAAGHIASVVTAAVANAKKNPDIAESDLYVSKITIDGGPMFKRYKSGSMGRAMMIRHRTSHIFVELDLKKKKVAVKPAEKVHAGGVKVKEAKPAKKNAAVEKKTVKTTKKSAPAKRGK